MTRTAPFSAKAIRNACIAAAFAVAPVGVYAVGSAHNAKALAACNSGETLACYEVVDSKKAEITNTKYLADRKRSEEALAQAKADAEKQAAASKKRQAAADAKFKAEGWWEAQPGIFVRWCTNTCNNSKVIGDNRYSLMEVWAKDAHAGDIYAQVNLESNGVVIGWTNDTMYLSRGQRGVLTFDSYQYSDQARLVKFNARG